MQGRKESGDEGRERGLMDITVRLDAMSDGESDSRELIRGDDRVEGGDDGGVSDASASYSASHEVENLSEKGKEYGA